MFAKEEENVTVREKKNMKKNHRKENERKMRVRLKF